MSTNTFQRMADKQLFRKIVVLLEVSMDKRIEKTRYAIKNAFMELRAKKPLEKISVKELCEIANINKSTFYSHYEDIHALSDALEYEMVLKVVSSIPKDLDYTFAHPELFTREVTIAFTKHWTQIKIMFSGKSQTHLSNHLEAIIKKLIYSKYPEYEKNIEKNILLSYCIHGAFNANLSNPNADPETVIRVLENAVRALKPLF